MESHELAHLPSSFFMGGHGTFEPEIFGMSKDFHFHAVDVKCQKL